MGEGGEVNGDDGAASGERAFIWGTEVDIARCIAHFERFFDQWREQPSSGDDADGADADTNPLYWRLLAESLYTSSGHLDVDCRHLAAADMELYSHLVAYPAEVLPAFDRVVAAKREVIVERMRAEMEAEGGVADELQDDPSLLYEVRPCHMLRSSNMRLLNPDDIDSLVSIKGMVIRCGAIIPEMRMAAFQCAVCQHVQEVVVVDGEIQQPTKCANPLCRASHSYGIVHNRCQFDDKQLLKVQETPDNIPEGETPHSVTVFVYRDVVDSCKPGDRVEITGVFRAAPNRSNPRQSTLHTVYRTYIDGIHIRTYDHRHDTDARSPDQQMQSSATVQALQKQREAILELAANPLIYQQLVASLAPSIFEHDDVKKGLLCQLFGGALSEEGAGHGRFRGEINVLLCGDPGTAKSQLLQYVHKLAPRGIYTSGKGSSAVGLTASISKDAETRELVLESGALVLSDRGICCIDEFDKMSDSTRSILHEVMEQQTVSIAKAGIVCTLNARTSILASANPKESRYNPNLSVVDNIAIMPTLLSRFDLIYLVLDNHKNEQQDRRLARHLVSLYFNDKDRGQHSAARQQSGPPLQQQQQRPAIIPVDLLTAYIAYARRNVKPQLSQDARDLLIEGYRAMRRVGQTGNNKVVTATPRQLEALIRLSEALARLHLRPTVNADDVREACRLMDVSTQQAATDKATGRIDMDKLVTGHGAEERRREAHMLDAMRDVIEQLAAAAGGGRGRAGGGLLKVGAIVSSFNSASQLAIDDEQAKQLLEELVAEGFVTRAGGAGRRLEAVRKV